MHTTHVVLVILLAIIFLISGLSKASGNPKGLSGTRDVNVPDGLARVIGLFEALAALGLVVGLRANFIQWGSLIFYGWQWAGLFIRIFVQTKQRQAYLHLFC